MFMPLAQSTPITALVKPAVLATDRSISPVMMTSVIGRAIMRMGITSSSRNPAVRAEANLGTTSESTITTARTKYHMTAPRLVNTRVAVERPATISADRTSDIASLANPQPASHPQAGNTIYDHCRQDERAHDGLLPELVHPDGREGACDRCQEQPAQRSADNTSHATGDGHATDHRSCNHLKFHASAGRGADGVEPRGVEDPSQAGQQAVGDEHREDPFGHWDAVELRCIAVRANRIEVTSAAHSGQVDSDDSQDDEGDQGDQRDAENRLHRQVAERVRAIAGEVLLPAGPGVVDAAVDVQGAECDHESRYLGDGYQKAIDSAQDAAEQDGYGEDGDDRDPREGRERHTHGVGRESEHRTDGQVDVLGHENEGLSGCQDHQNRGVEQQVLHALGGQERWIHRVGQNDKPNERCRHRELAPAEDAPEPIHATTSAEAVAARITVSGVASARENLAVIRPSCITMTRSAIPSTSGSSEEIIKIAIPCPARSDSNRWTSLLVPTSMPRVGSSTMSSFGCVAVSYTHLRAH